MTFVLLGNRGWMRFPNKSKCHKSYIESTSQSNEPLGRCYYYYYYYYIIQGRFFSLSSSLFVAWSSMGSNFVCFGVFFLGGLYNMKKTKYYYYELNKKIETIFL
jgi:hypothetical protein